MSNARLDLAESLWKLAAHYHKEVRQLHGFALDDLTHVGMAAVFRKWAIRSANETADQAKLIALMLERGGDVLDAYCYATDEMKRRNEHGHPRSDRQGQAGDLG